MSGKLIEKCREIRNKICKVFEPLPPRCCYCEQPEEGDEIIFLNCCRRHMCLHHLQTPLHDRTCNGIEGE